MASSPTRQIQAKGAKPEDHVNDFLDFISQFCAKKGYQGLRDLSQENEDLKTKLKQAEPGREPQGLALLLYEFADARRYAKQYTKVDESYSIPLPASNSLAAKQMRVAAGLAVLATALQRQIFQPLYLGADSNEFVVFLESFREMDPQHELYLRSVLLKSHLEKQKEFGRIRAKNAAMEAMLMLQMLIPSDKLVDCMAEVTRICEDALKQWMPLQKIKQQVVANMRFEKPSEMGLALDLPVAARAPDSAKANKQRVGSKSQAGQASSTQPEDEDSSSDEEDVYVVWPAFFSGKALLQKGRFVTDEQISAAKREIKMEQKAAKKKNRQSSESDTT
ncbi:hypothetical protein S7711_10432 [Stachybotrys chartarum IBT 7711]|uniref:Uncharacterized protein n=1 Tax=Stachybotrys chartarum (strain CBS 109288 / IBT 7711) TaxID=1280523 RepID=A0A084BBH5_STACB|nr:hypothetical protein S7711_10432 [Stachybotrys chartarum IBT 7711]